MRQLASYYCAPADQTANDGLDGKLYAPFVMRGNMFASQHIRRVFYLLGGLALSVALYQITEKLRLATLTRSIGFTIDNL